MASDERCLLFSCSIGLNSAPFYQASFVCKGTWCKVTRFFLYCFKKLMHLMRHSGAFSLLVHFLKNFDACLTKRIRNAAYPIIKIACKVFKILFFNFLICANTSKKTGFSSPTLAIKFRLFVLTTSMWCFTRVSTSNNSILVIIVNFFVN